MANSLVASAQWDWTDSFLARYVREEMRGKPHLQLEVDEHSADAGMITRCEAFLDSLRAGSIAEARDKESSAISVIRAAAVRACGLQAEVLTMQDEEDLEWGRKYTSSRECFPMICTTGSFLKKLHEPGLDPAKASFFMPSHGGPCRFGQYHKLQRIIMENLGFKEVEIVSPTNQNSYADFTRGHGVKFRLLAWKGMVAADMLAKMWEQRRPYEAVPGQTGGIYQRYLNELARSLERGGARTLEVLKEAGEAFKAIEMLEVPRKLVTLIVGEIFMRDNPFCSGFLRRVRRTHVDCPRRKYYPLPPSVSPAWPNSTCFF